MGIMEGWDRDTEKALFPVTDSSFPPWLILTASFTTDPGYEWLAEYTVG
jgi:hypothetical protein